jgi:hypothetical protein
MASREQKAKKNATSDEEINWLMEAWRKAG